MYEGAPHNVRSVLMMRKLILTDTTVAPMISLLPQRQPLVVEPSTNLIDMLNEFQVGFISAFGFHETGIEAGLGSGSGSAQ